MRWSNSCSSAAVKSPSVTEGTPLNMALLLKLVKEDKGRVKLLPDGKVVVHTEEKPVELIGTLRNLLMNIVSL